MIVSFFDTDGFTLAINVATLLLLTVAAVSELACHAASGLDWGFGKQ